jgi:hypothetical protein
LHQFFVIYLAFWTPKFFRATFLLAALYLRPRHSAAHDFWKIF